VGFDNARIGNLLGLSPSLEFLFLFSPSSFRHRPPLILAHLLSCETSPPFRLLLEARVKLDSSVATPPKNVKALPDPVPIPGP